MFLTPLPLILSVAWIVNFLADLLTLTFLSVNVVLVTGFAGDIGFVGLVGFVCSEGLFTLILLHLFLLQHCRFDNTCNGMTF